FVRPPLRVAVPAYPQGVIGRHLQCVADLPRIGEPLDDLQPPLDEVRVPAVMPSNEIDAADPVEGGTREIRPVELEREPNRFLTGGARRVRLLVCERRPPEGKRPQCLRNEDAYPRLAT